MDVKKVFLTLICNLMNPIDAWSTKYHIAMSIVALKDLGGNAQDDLLRRVKLLSVDIPSGSNYTYISVLADQIRNNKMCVFNCWHFENLFGNNNKLSYSTTFSFEKLYTLKTYLETREKEDDLMDTLGIILFTHLSQDLFQPFHNFEKTGNDLEFEGISLHSYWDSLLNFFGGKDASKIAKELEIIYKQRFFIFNNEKVPLKSQEKDIKLFLGDWRGSSVFSYLKNQYNWRVGNQARSSFFLSPYDNRDNFKNPVYLKEGIKVCLENMEISICILKRTMEIFYSKYKYQDRLEILKKNNSEMKWKVLFFLLFTLNFIGGVIGGYFYLKRKLGWIKDWGVFKKIF